MHRLSQLPLYLTLLLATGGCAARYHTVRSDLPEGASASGTVNGASDGGDATAQPAAPTAEVEVIVSGQSVTTVTTGQAFTIRPTADTLVPGSTDACTTNPGIVSVQYVLSDLSTLGITRNQDCADFGVVHSISKAGSYQIQMQVSTPDHQTATATMTLLVTDSPQASGGFVVTATPTSTQPGTSVSFSGTCSGTVAWDYGDHATGTGAQSQHAYAAVGQYAVKATCTLPDNTQLQGGVTVTVVVGGASGSPAATGSVDGATGATGPTGTGGGTGASSSTTGGGYGPTGGGSYGPTGGSGGTGGSIPTGKGTPVGKGSPGQSPVQTK